MQAAKNRKDKTVCIKCRTLKQSVSKHYRDSSRELQLISRSAPEVSLVRRAENLDELLFGISLVQEHTSLT